MHFFCEGDRPNHGIDSFDGIVSSEWADVEVHLQYI
jgi:hypothetical protein